MIIVPLVRPELSRDLASIFRTISLELIFLELSLSSSKTSPKNNVLTVKVRSRDKGDKKLGPIGIFSGVGHGEEIGFFMFLYKVLIVEIIAIDGLSTGTVSTGEVTALGHEIRNNTVELGPSVAKSLLTSAKGTKVLCGSGGYVIIEVEYNSTPFLFLTGRRLVTNIEVSLDNHGSVCGVEETGAFREWGIDDVFDGGFRDG